MDLISSADYARHAGLSRATVCQQIARGKIPIYGENGERMAPGEPGRKFIDAAEADLARRQTRARVPNIVDEPVISADEKGVRNMHALGAAQSTLTQAKRDTEAHRSELLRLDLEERRGKLMPVAKVLDAMAVAGEKIVRIIDQLPMDADDLATSVARGGSQALRAALKEVARRMRTAIADSLNLGGS